MKNGFIKKIAAVFTAASMIASLGTVAFAANYDGTGIKINVDGVGVYNTKADGETRLPDGEFRVKVAYTVDNGVTNNIGVTMLAYAGESLSTDASGYTAYNGETMQIVGIDQQKQSGQTGNFEFYVTTNNDNGAIKVAYGVPSIVLVSGDKVTPAAATFTISEPAWQADTAEYTGSGEFNVDWPYDIAAIKTAIADNITKDDIKLTKSGTTKEANFSSLGTVSVDKINVTQSGDTYSAVFTFPADATVEGAELAAGLTSVEIPSLTINKNAWTVTSTGYGADNKLEIASQDSLAAVKTAIETKLAEVGVTVKGAQDGMTKTIKTVTVGDPVVSGGAEFDATCAEAQTVTAEVTANIAEETEITGSGDALKFTLTVTVKSASAAKWDITSATMSGDQIKFDDQESTVTADGLKASVETEVKRRTVTLKGASDSETEVVSLADATVAVKDAATFKYNVTIPSTVTTTSALIPDAGYTFEITVKVNYKAAAVAYGDMNNDGKFNMADARVVLRIGLPEANPNHYNATAEEKVKADVNNDGKFNMADARLILRRGLPEGNDNRINKFPVEEAE